MSDMTILITGATGRLGRLVTQRLIERGQSVRVFARRPDLARSLFGDKVQIAVGEFADRASINTAVKGVERLLLLSPVGQTLVADQVAVANAATAASIRRIVKISGSDWTIDPAGMSISGDAHAAVERHIGTLALDHVSLRPNAWMQGSLANTIRQVLAGNPVFAANPDAGVGYLDARDIADVAVDQLLADDVFGRTLNLTGPEIVTARQIADILSASLNRRVPVIEKRPVAPASDADVDFEHRAVAQFGTLIAAGRAAVTTDVVATILRRQPRSAAAFISEILATEAALAGSPA